MSAIFIPLFAQSLNINCTCFGKIFCTYKIEEIYTTLLCFLQVLLTEEAVIWRIKKSAVNNCALKQTFCSKLNLIQNASTTGRLSSYCNVFWIPSECTNIVFYPLHGTSLIKQSKVCRFAWIFSGNFRMTKEAKHIKTIVYCYNNNSTAGNSLSVKFHFCSKTSLPATTVNPEIYRKLFVCSVSRRPYVHSKTIFAHRNIFIYRPFAAINIIWIIIRCWLNRNW